MTESDPPPVVEAKPEKPRTIRLVIRAEILPKEPPTTAAPRPVSRRALVVIAGVVAVVALIWIGIIVFRSKPDSASERTQNSEHQVPKPATRTEPAPTSTAATAETRSEKTAPVVEPKSIEARTAGAKVRDESGAPPSPVHEVVPNPSRSALQTIRGTIRVSVRVTIDQQGAVIAAMPEDPGPSRYFERVAVNAAKKWTFAPVDSEAQRTMLLRFQFTTEGATASADK